MTENATEAAKRTGGPSVLICAASRRGATGEIAQAIGQVLAERGFSVAVIPPDEVRSIDGYDAVIVGSAVYMGRWLDSAKEFVHRFSPTLAEHPVWLFSSGPVGKPGSKLTQSMDQDPLDIPEMVKATHARDHRMFAGKLDPRGFSLARRVSLLVFRSLNGDFRDWADIRQWAEGVALQLPAVLSADRTEQPKGVQGNGSM